MYFYFIFIFTNLSLSIQLRYNFLFGLVSPLDYYYYVCIRSNIIEL